MLTQKQIHEQLELEAKAREEFAREVIGEEWIAFESAARNHYREVCEQLDAAMRFLALHTDPDPLCECGACEACRAYLGKEPPEAK